MAPTVVLIPGACHGGWWYDPVVEALTADGQPATAVTLPGLEQRPAVDRLITLDTHIEHTLAALPHDGPVVLVGHSYSGMVITAVADRIPDRVTALVYLDAVLPHDGDSCWDLINDEHRQWYISGCARTGYGVDPLPFFDDRARPHPVATLLQAASLTGAWQQVPTKHYVAATWPEESPMATSTDRADADPEFAVHHWDTGHNVLADSPRHVLDLIRSP